MTEQLLVSFQTGTYICPGTIHFSGKAKKWLLKVPEEMKMFLSYPGINVKWFCHNPIRIE